MISFADAMGRMKKSRVLSAIREALDSHCSAAHDGLFLLCPLSACSQFDSFVRLCVEVAQEELDTAQKICQARKLAINACPGASDDTIVYLAESFVKASSPPDDSSHPLNWLESPYDPARIYNCRYPGLEFHRGPHRNAAPAISSAYYLRFRDADYDAEADRDKLLFEFMDAHPIEFQCSGWVFSVLGGKLLGPPRPSANEEEARNLFRKYWTRIKRPKDVAPTMPQRFIKKIADLERARFSGKHRACFKRVVTWLWRRNDPSVTFVAFKRERRCACIDEHDFAELAKLVPEIVLRTNSRRPTIPTSHLAQEYVGHVCGVPDRTLRSW